MRPSRPADIVLRSGYNVLTSISLRNAAHLTCMSRPTQNSAPRRGAILNLVAPVRYLRRLQEAAAALQAQQQQPQQSKPIPPQQPTPATTPTTRAAKATQSPTVASSAPGTASGSTPPSSGVNGYFDQPMNALLPSEYPIAADTFPFAFDNTNVSSSHHSAGLSINTTNPKSPSSSGHSDHALSTVSSHPSAQPLNPQAKIELYRPTCGSSMTWTLPSPSPTNSTLTPPPGAVQRMYPALNHFTQQRHSLDNLPVPRDQIMEILKLFFLYVYPLTPCIHKPTFMTDLQSRREERDPLFFALVMSTVASTLVQVPRSYLPAFDRASVRKLASYCSEASRLITVAGYNSPNSTQVVIRYLYVFTILQQS